MTEENKQPDVTENYDQLIELRNVINKVLMECDPVRFWGQDLTKVAPEYIRELYVYNRALRSLIMEIIEARK